MKYQLKNKELQAKLEAIYPKFGVALSSFFGNQKDKTCITFLLGQGIDVTLFIRNSAIEEVHEFDPTKWNVWPDVLPPKTGYYRVEFKDSYSTKKAAWMWDGLGWQIQPGAYFLLDSANKEGIRFKPWDDEEEE